MDNFPCRAKERIHTRGSGLKQDYPDPGPGGIECDPEEVVTEPPVRGAVKIAALIRRHLRFASAYRPMADRYVGGSRWRACPTPERYLPGPVDDVVSAIWRPCLSHYGWGSLFTLPVEGGTYLYDDGDVVARRYIARVGPLPDTDTAVFQAFARSQSLPDWLDLATGNIWAGEVTMPSYPIYLRLSDADPEHQIDSGTQSATLESLVVTDVGEMSAARLAILLLLWGRCPRPYALAPQIVADSTPHLAGNDEQWLEIIRTVAGRVVWQMFWIAAELQKDDLLRRHKGGRGGLGGGAVAPETPFIPLAPPPPLPVGPLPTPTSPWADALGPIIIDVIVAGLSLL